ncbi:PASTA domain-containing protein [Xylanibacter ruminicola]|uniref:PASTA domain protein n=2 Tax=Xylanibacter ruminicola TaxID=839 RepID=D5EV60_XYLR2|nr:PASTA domain-containing protein [Xylanibacter ruminicola]ADE81235.1 PASTA domain protein [Xylanibacter ruminicola 23]MBQ6054010.1 PASTA domain-containing protein [Prevotella sp.]GJG34650.1 PASTA domain-containing protein [Xylanibacter ruminicola]SEH90085.1 PASTA domain-containing protein [Xylanibacter ruminicola]
MRTKEFFGKFCSKFLFWNLIAMALVVILLVVGVNYGLDWYTHHGESIRVPNIEGMRITKAREMMEECGLEIVVTDSGYNKRLPADCVLTQSPGAGLTVKSGHTIYVTINSSNSPSVAIPDVVDNCSYREAEAKLISLGFKVLPPQYVTGEKDWVYGVSCNGRKVSTGERISIEQPLTLLVGSGQYGADEELNVIGGDDAMMQSGNGEVDDFEEVTE